MNEQRRPPREMNNSTDASYRAEDALRVPGAEPGFDEQGRGLHDVAQAGATTGYAKAQETPTAGYPEEG